MLNVIINHDNFSLFSFLITQVLSRTTLKTFYQIVGTGLAKKISDNEV